MRSAAGRVHAEQSAVASSEDRGPRRVAAAFRLRQEIEAGPLLCKPGQHRISYKFAGDRPFPDNSVGPSGFPPAASGLHDRLAGVRHQRLWTFKRSARSVSSSGAGCQMRHRANRHYFWNSGSYRSRSSIAGESRRSRVAGGPRLSSGLRGIWSGGSQSGIHSHRCGRRGSGQERFPKCQANVCYAGPSVPNWNYDGSSQAR